MAQAPIAPALFQPQTRQENWICCQIGRREHYAVPRALNQSRRLATLYTDFWAGPAVRLLAGKKLRPLATRFHADLPDARVHSWNARTLAGQAIRPGRSEGAGPYHSFIKTGQRFAERVRGALRSRSDLGPGSILFAYDTGALEALEWGREHGIKCILNQMDPNRIEVAQVREEETRWPSWALRPTSVPEEIFQAARERMGAGGSNRGQLRVLPPGHANPGSAI